MKYKEINNIKVSEIGLGTWGLSGDWGVNFEEDNILDLLNHAFEKGINYFDTAPVYGKGYMESVLGKFKHKNDIIISTKIPAIKKPELGDFCSISDFYNPKYIQDILSSSLNRLEREYVDLLMLHNWHPAWNKQSSEILSYLDSLKKDGKAKAIGVSLPNNMSADFSDIAGLEFIDFFMVPLNLLQQWSIPYIEQIGKNRKIFIIARSIFERGKLIKNQKEIEMCTRFSGNNAMQASEQIREIAAFYEEKSIEDRIRYCMNFSQKAGADCLLLGMSSRKEIDFNTNGY